MIGHVHLKVLPKLWQTSGDDMFTWTLLLLLQIGGEVDTLKYSVHQTLDTCVESGEVLATHFTVDRRPASIEKVSIVCSQKNIGVEV